MKEGGGRPVFCAIGEDVSDEGVFPKNFGVSLSLKPPLRMWHPGSR